MAHFAANLTYLFTELPMDEVRRLGALQGAEVNEAKKVLATEATALLHGRDAAEMAAETARRAFEEGAAAETLPSIAAALPAAFIDLAVQAGLAASKGEARRLIAQNGLRLNDAAVTESVRQSAVKVLGADRVSAAPRASMGAEDFAYYLLERPGTFIWIGICNPAKGICEEIHHPRFDVDEEIFRTIPLVYTQAILDLLA